MKPTPIKSYRILLLIMIFCDTFVDQEFISKIIAKNHRYEDVFDIIKHVEELACIRNIGPSLQITEFNEKESTNNENTKEAAPIVNIFMTFYSTIYLLIFKYYLRSNIRNLKRTKSFYK